VKGENDMKAVAYIRVSTVGQAEDGVSLDAQRARIEAWALANDAELVSVHVDAGLSGSKADNRPALQAALVAACKAKAAVVVYSLSRLARSVKDTIAISERLDKAGADLVSLSEKIDTTTAAGKMVFRMLAVLAEFERDIIAERTATAMRYKRSCGEYTGGVEPYGWRLAADGRNLEVNEQEQCIMAIASDLKAAGLSLRKIGERLAEEGLLPRCGGQWHAKTVRALLMARAA
jgi:site-specific DNA recombinase